MIAFRHTDPRFPFLQETEHASYPPGRWNARGELTHYFSDTPDGAWAEFLRHEEIMDAKDLPTIRRALWAVDIGVAPAPQFDPPKARMLGGRDNWPACQRWARALRRKGAEGLVAPSAALFPGGAHGWRVDAGLQPGPARNGRVFALFGSRPDLVGWAATAQGQPSKELLARVRHFGRRRRLLAHPAKVAG